METDDLGVMKTRPVSKPMVKFLQSLEFLEGEQV